MKNETEIKIKTYKEILSELNNKKAHLLLGNGFNNSLGIETGYQSIFEKMGKEHTEYKDLTSKLDKYNYDIEKLILDLRKQIKKQIQNSKYNSFLSKYTQRKIKSDFMKATYSLVKNQVKEVYNEKNRDIYQLLKKFTNYFTLNYDPHLYLLLMKFKKSKKSDTNNDKENQKLTLDINDGFIPRYYTRGKIIFNPSDMQNTFFLHGAFHIYQDGTDIVKITQTQKKRFYEKLEEVIDSEIKDIICVLAGTSEGKENIINNDRYLKSGFDKLSTLSGELVIIGCSLADNDDHIFAQIRKSEIEKIFISSRKNDKNCDYKKAKEKFPHKNIVLFDRETISYTN